MKAMGVELNELKNHGGFSFCCGGARRRARHRARGAPALPRHGEQVARDRRHRRRHLRHQLLRLPAHLRRCADPFQLGTRSRTASWNWSRPTCRRPETGHRRAQTIVVDPVTRIEGHLRIEAEFDGSVITRASSSGTMVRGIEIILQGRDPRDAWAFAQRICGVCTLVHGIASVRAVEDALHYAIPANAQLIRNLMIATQFVHDHVMHFYHLHALDWVDVVSALKADPKATSALAQSISNYERSSPGYFADVQDRIKKLVESGQLGIFANAYWGHPGYALPPEANLMAVAHYLDALAWQRQVVQLADDFRRARIRIPMCWWAALRPPSACMPAREPVPPPSTKWACRRWPPSSNRCATSSMRCTCPTPGHRVVLQGLVQDRLWRRQWKFHDLRRFPEHGPGSENLPGAARCDSRPRPHPHPGSRSERRGRHPGIRRALPGTTTAAARIRACIPTAARRS